MDSAEIRLRHCATKGVLYTTISGGRGDLSGAERVNQHQRRHPAAGSTWVIRDQLDFSPDVIEKAGDGVRIPLFSFYPVLPILLRNVKGICKVLMGGGS